MLRAVPKPVLALILLFPFAVVRFIFYSTFLVSHVPFSCRRYQVKRERDMGKKNKEKGEAENTKLLQALKESDRPFPYFLHQRRDGCCGPITVIHSVTNCPQVQLSSKLIGNISWKRDIQEER